MRPLATVCAIVSAFSLAGTASAGTAPPESGYIVLKDLRSYAVTEVRDKATGRVVASTAARKDTGAAGTACGDSRHKFLGAYWHEFEAYLVNVGSTPPEINAAAALADIKAAHKAWENPFTTDCANVPGTSAYRSIYGGTTNRQAGLVASLTPDGLNTVAFQSLAGTVCDGGLACVVLDYERSTIMEADLAFERNLSRYGFQDFWTTDDTTWFDSAGGRAAVVDVATHEWGHFAGLDHVEKSPALTMFPAIHDGDQTLGLGDMKGLLALY